MYFIARFIIRLIKNFFLFENCWRIIFPINLTSCFPCSSVVFICFSYWFLIAFIFFSKAFPKTSSNINEVIRPVLNFFFLGQDFTSTKKHKNLISVFYQCRLKVDLVLYTYGFIYLKVTIKKFIFTWVLIPLLI